MLYRVVKRGKHTRRQAGGAILAKQDLHSVSKRGQRQERWGGAIATQDLGKVKRLELVQR